MTNQMILACKAYLTEDDKINIWNEAKSVMISKIKVNINLYVRNLYRICKQDDYRYRIVLLQDCIKLCEQYHDYYNEMCQEVKQSSDEKPFEVSEMYVFGKFNTFKTRIIKVSNNVTS